AEQNRRPRSDFGPNSVGRPGTIWRVRRRRIVEDGGLLLHSLGSETRPELLPFFLGHRLLAYDASAQFFILEIGKCEPAGSARELHVSSGGEQVGSRPFEGLSGEE